MAMNIRDRIYPLKEKKEKRTRILKHTLLKTFIKELKIRNWTKEIALNHAKSGVKIHADKISDDDKKAGLSPRLKVKVTIAYS